MTKKIKKTKKDATQQTIKEVIINHLKNHKDVSSPMEIAKASGRAIKSIRQKLRELIANGTVEATYDSKTNHYTSLTLSYNFLEASLEDSFIESFGNQNSDPSYNNENHILIPDSRKEEIISIDPAKEGCDVSGIVVFIDGQMYRVEDAYEKGLITEDEVINLGFIEPTYSEDVVNQEQFEEEKRVEIEVLDLNNDVASLPQNQVYEAVIGESVYLSGEEAESVMRKNLGLSELLDEVEPNNSTQKPTESTSLFTKILRKIGLK